MLATSRVGDLRRAAVGAARRLSSSAAPTPSPAFDQGHYNVIAACYVGTARARARAQARARAPCLRPPRARRVARARRRRAVDLPRLARGGRRDRHRAQGQAGQAAGGAGRDQEAPRPMRRTATRRRAALAHGRPKREVVGAAKRRSPHAGELAGVKCGRRAGMQQSLSQSNRCERNQQTAHAVSPSGGGARAPSAP